MSKAPDSFQIEDVSLFHGFRGQELAALKRNLRQKEFEKGAVVFSEGDKCERILIVREGRVKIFRMTPDGKEQVLEVLGPGDSCACNPGATSWCCSASAQALVDSSVWMLARDHYAFLIKNNHRLARTLNELLAQRLCRFCSLIESVSLDAPTKRLVKFLLDMSEGSSNGPVELKIPLTHEEISQRIGLVRETVTRHLSRLKKKKLIDAKAQKIIVLDRDGLRNLLLN